RETMAQYLDRRAKPALRTGRALRNCADDTVIAGCETHDLRGLAVPDGGQHDRVRLDHGHGWSVLRFEQRLDGNERDGRTPGTSAQWNRPLLGEVGPEDACAPGGLQHAGPHFNPVDLAPGIDRDTAVPGERETVPR